MHIRKAVIGDVKAVHKILNHFAAQGLLLPRSLSELYDHLRDYYVYSDDDPIPSQNSHQDINHSIQGVCGLRICWEDLAEIKSLAIIEEMQGRGLGSRLVDVCLKEAGSFGLKKVFTLTYVPDFFVGLGFKKIDKAVLPHKIWADCLNCPKFPNCDETALMINL